MSDSPRGGSGDFAKKVQRQLSRGKEKVLQRLGKTVETRDEQFDLCLQVFNDQQTDGNRIYKDLRNYIHAVRDMREASRRLSQSMYDVYESDWVGEEDMGAIVEGEDLLWNDYEVKMVDQVIRTMESYVSQFPDVKDKVAKRGRKLVDYDSCRHQLEALQSAKKRDDVKIRKAEEELKLAKSVYEGINSELKEELPVLHDSRIGCYVSVFCSVSNLREIFYKEMKTLNMDLQNVIKELQMQYPDKVFAVKGVNRYGSLRRRTLMSPKAWKSSFSEFHRSYNPRGGQRSSFRSPDKPRHGTLTRESSGSLVVSPRYPTLGSPASLAGELGEDSLPTGERDAERRPDPPVDDDPAVAGSEQKVELVIKPEEKEEDSESSSGLDQSSDSESLDHQLSAEVDGLHIEEEEDEDDDAPRNHKHNGLENGEVAQLDPSAAELELHHKVGPFREASAENPDSKSTVV
ncbi:bridging integrator 2a [Neosynchiropus ocellatus]